MPKLQVYREAFYTFTGKVSDNVRTLSIAAVGIAWLFKIQQGNSYQIPQELYTALVYIFSALLADFIQYVYGSLAWYIYYRHKELKDTSEDDELKPTDWINAPHYIFFLAKIILLIIGYRSLLLYLVSNIELI